MNVVSHFLACLSAEEIGVSLTIGYYAAAVAVVITSVMLVLNWRQHDYRWLPLYGALLLVHPTWTMSVYMGDCGYGRRFLSVAISLIFMAVLACQLIRPGLRVRWFLLILSVVCWVAYGASQLYWQIVDYTWFLDLLSTIFSSGAIEAFLFASPTLLRAAIVMSVASAFLFALSESRTLSQRRAIK